MELEFALGVLHNAMMIKKIFNDNRNGWDGVNYVGEVEIQVDDLDGG